MKTITISGYDRLQLLSLSHALHMADKHKMYCYCHPTMIRHLSKVWLAKAGVEVKGTERWSSLNKKFLSVYALVIAGEKGVDTKEAL
jgi:hypothetical protein